MYSVYLKVFKTKKHKTKRSYIGYTGNIDVRAMRQIGDPPAWQKCLMSGSERFYILEEELPNRPTARALEALHAARAISKTPKVARGGPWLRPTLHEGFEQEVTEVAKCRTLKSIFKLADRNPAGRLAQHLQGLSFDSSGDGQPVRGGFVKQNRSGPSGVSRNKYRKKQVAKKLLKRPSA